jgi:hypothetical protein
MISVTELDASEGHSRPGLDIGGKEHQRTVLDDLLEV